jgi:hypothetical protein
MSGEVEFDGLVTFFASFHAVRADKVLRKHGREARLVPGPRDISPHCGVALQFRYDEEAEVRTLLVAGKVQVEAFHRYRLGELSAMLR